MERKKNECLAAIYQKEYPALGALLNEVLEFIENQDILKENDEKAAHQILIIFKRFKSDFIDQVDPEVINTCNAIKKSIVYRINAQRKAVLHIDFPIWKQRTNLNADQLSLVFKTAMTFQVTCGCSHFCRRCNEWALPGVRSHFSYQTILEMLNEMAHKKNDEISLYGASDPLDWEENNKNIADITDHVKTLPLEYSLLSKVPKGKKTVLVELLKNNANISVSVTTKNKHRVQKIEAEIDYPLYKQHDLDELLIPAGLDEDFATVKPSITDGYGTEITPDGAFIIIPTFTSALNPFGHKKIAITRNTTFFPQKKTGRHALLIDYFKPLKGYDLNQKPICLGRLMDVQIESIILDNGEDRLTPPGMTSLKEYLFIFDETARFRREKMTPSVLKRLKEKFLVDTTFESLPAYKKSIFLKKMQRHLELCKNEYCIQFKLYALSFFYDSIKNYLKMNPLKAIILKQLIKDEIKGMPYRDKDIESSSVEKNILNPDLDDFKLFRYYLICLFDHKKTKQISTFIKDYPAGYDPVTDLFIDRSEAILNYQ